MPLILAPAYQKDSMAVLWDATRQAIVEAGDLRILMLLIVWFTSLKGLRPGQQNCYESRMKTTPTLFTASLRCMWRLVGSWHGWRCARPWHSICSLFKWHDLGQCHPYERDISFEYCSSRPFGCCDYVVGDLYFSKC